VTLRTFSSSSSDEDSSDEEEDSFFASCKNIVILVKTLKIEINPKACHRCRLYSRCVQDQGVWQYERSAIIDLMGNTMQGQILIGVLRKMLQKGKDVGTSRAGICGRLCSCWWVYAPTAHRPVSSGR